MDISYFLLMISQTDKHDKEINGNGIINKNSPKRLISLIFNSLPEIGTSPLFLV